RRNNQFLNLLPHLRIQVHARVGSAKGLFVPWHAREINGLVAIAELNVTDNFRLPRILCLDCSSPVHEKPIVLKEVDGSGNVGGNDLIMAANAIDLDGQHDRNIELLQLAHELDDRCASEALPVNNQARGLELARIQYSVTVPVEGPEHQFQRDVPLSILDCCHLHTGKVHLA